MTIAQPDHTTAPALHAGLPRAAAESATPAIVAVVGNGVPAELIDAAGLTIRHILPLPVPANVPVGMMEAGHEAEIRGLFAAIQGGAAADAAMLVVPGTTDGYRYLYHYLKEERRQGRPGIPPLVAFDLLFEPRDSVRRHCLAEIGRLRDRLASLSGRVVDDDAITLAITGRNAVRRRHAAIEGLRLAGELSGTAAHAAHRALFDHPAAPLPAGKVIATGRKRVLLVPAAPLYGDHVHRCIEDNGGLVLAEDDWRGSRAGGPDVAAGDDPLAGILTWLQGNALSPRMDFATRFAWLKARIAEDGLDAVIIHMPADDQDFGWSYPRLASLLDASGLPHLVIAADAQHLAEHGVPDAVSRFLASGGRS